MQHREDVSLELVVSKSLMKFVIPSEARNLSWTSC